MNERKKKTHHKANARTRVSALKHIPRFLLRRASAARARGYTCFQSDARCSASLRPPEKFTSEFHSHPFKRARARALSAAVHPRRPKGARVRGFPRATSIPTCGSSSFAHAGR